MKKTTLLFLIGIIFTSCATTKTGTVKTMDIIGPGVLHMPVVVDLDVKQTKATTTETFSNTKSLEIAKNEVVRKLTKEQNADLLVEPTFESKTSNGKTTLTVVGFPANYKNFRSIEEKDLKLLEVKPGYLQKAETYQPTVVEKKRKKGVGWIILAVVLAGIGAATAGF